MYSDRIVKNILGNNIRRDNYSLDYTKLGPNEYWVPIKKKDQFGNEETIFIKKRKMVTLTEAKRIMGSPWLSYDEKVDQLKKLGASSSMIRMASLALRRPTRRY